MTFSDALRYRRAWLGVAMIWIIMFHVPIAISTGILRDIKINGYGGVDICLFASGIGCYYSLSSNPDIGSFMKRRLRKLAPCYLLFIIAWLIYKYICKTFTVQMAIGNIFAIQNFTGLGNAFNWYISAIFLLYLLTPYFKEIIDKTSPFIKYGFLLFLIVLSIPFWNSTTYIITITRLPIYYIGMLFATVCQQNKKITLKHVILLSISFVVGIVLLKISREYLSEFLWSHGLYWYPFILITPPLCFAISYIMRFIEKIKVLKLLASVLSKIGDYSFEIYLIHIPLIEVIKKCLQRFDLYDNQTLIWLGGIVVLSISCFLLRRTANLCVSLLSGKKSNKNISSGLTKAE